jgi:formate dehydrogenase maturation protein FdhE
MEHNALAEYQVALRCPTCKSDIVGSVQSPVTAGYRLVHRCPLCGVWFSWMPVVTVAATEVAPIERKGG